MGQPPVIGSPETMIKRIQGIARIGHCGRFDFVLFHAKLPQELACNSLKLFGREVIPALKASTRNAFAAQ